MYEIVGYQTVLKPDTDVVIGFKVHLIECGFTSVTEGFAVVSNYFSIEKIKGTLSVGAHCNILYSQSSRGAYPAALLIG